MIHHVDKYPIYSIFDSNSNLFYYIPKYQREYTWKYGEWEALYDDISENDEGYFIGSIICINQGDGIKPALEVIDGQQRLTTVSLFITAIYNRLNQYEGEMSRREWAVLQSIEDSLRRENSETQTIIVPQVQGFNRDDYNFIMSSNGLREFKDTKKPYFGSRRISRCYEYFLGRLDREIADLDTQGKISFLLRKYDKLKKAMLVKIEVNSHSDAYILFESLNNRGAQLTAIDLMKNLIMARAEKAGLKVDYCFDTWQNLLGYLSEDYKTQERFFRHYYNAFKNRLNQPFQKDEDRKKDPLGVVATKSNLLPIYERLINHDLKGFLDDILMAGEAYSLLLRPADYSATVAYSDALVDLNHIQGVPSYILLLHLIYNKDHLQLSDKIIEAIIKLLVIFFVRRNTTDYPATRDVPRMFMGIISEIEEQGLKGSTVYDFILKQLKENTAPNDLFIRALSGDIYKTNAEVARYILCALARGSMTKETFTDLWKRSETTGVFIWTIEHIFPEGENIPAEWVDMIAGGDKDLAHKYLEEYVHKLGNLTMTGYNSELGNYSFEKKRDRTSRKDPGKYIGYKNGLGINQCLAEKDSWTIEDIKTRTADLCDQAAKMFTYPE